MINKGVIQQINGKKILVKLYKDSSCSHCSGCGDKFGKNYEFETDLKANIGDTVTFDIESTKVFKAALIAYILPILFMFGGYFFGEKVLKLSENQSICSSFIFLIIAFIFLFFYDKFYVKKHKNSEINIISIEKEDNTITTNSCNSKKS